MWSWVASDLVWVFFAFRVCVCLKTVCAVVGGVASGFVWVFFSARYVYIFTPCVYAAGLSD